MLVANRGEIAVRVIRALHELGAQAIAVYSDADRDSLHVSMADEAYRLGPGPASESYLSIPRLIQAAVRTRAEAIHPGYGFLAENAHFAAACATWGLDFIGPSPYAIEQMGNKAVARRMALEAKVPVIPGTDGAVSDASEALEAARQLGFPVLIKASAGGGGRGIRLAGDEAAFRESFEAARREAEAVFGDPGVYVERYLSAPRHVEIQVLADKHGHAVHLMERESSIQRRRQKLIEEAPSPVVGPRLRREMTRAALNMVEAVGYFGAGTVEFLVDGDRFYFMEMNTRVQVEHAVSEMITGIDIVKEQIRVASGLPLSFRQKDARPHGWAIEFRLNAEDPGAGFLPSPGRITGFTLPGGPGVRVDSGVNLGGQIEPLYDSLFAKLVVWGRTRQEAIERGRRALAEFRVDGVKTTLPLHQAILRDDDFLAGHYHTRWLEARLATGDLGRTEDAAEEPLTEGLPGDAEIPGSRDDADEGPGILVPA